MNNKFHKIKTKTVGRNVFSSQHKKKNYNLVSNASVDVTHNFIINQVNNHYQIPSHNLTNSSVLYKSKKQKKLETKNFKKKELVHQNQIGELSKPNQYIMQNKCVDITTGRCNAVKSLNLPESSMHVQEEEFIFRNNDIYPIDVQASIAGKRRHDDSTEYNPKRKCLNEDRSFFYGICGNYQENKYDMFGAGSSPWSHQPVGINRKMVPRSGPSYHEEISKIIWQHYLSSKQSEATYKRKIQLRNSLQMIMCHVFQNAKLFITGSSMNGFGTDNSDMDLSLMITSQELHQKKEAAAVLSELLGPLRKCQFLDNLQFIRATVPILKFKDRLAGVECDLNINNVDGIYNTHLLAMYNRVDWRLRPLGMFIKHWAQKLDLHDASKGRMSTYAIILMVVQYLQAGCQPPVLPSLQVLFPHEFSHSRQSNTVDLRLELPWNDLRSLNTSTLSDLLMGFFEYYVDRFDYGRMAVSVRTGRPIPMEVAMNNLRAKQPSQPPNPFKLFVEEPFSLINVSRSLYDDSVFPRLRRCFRHSLQVLRLGQPLDTMYILEDTLDPNTNPTETPQRPQPGPSTEKSVDYFGAQTIPPPFQRPKRFRRSGVKYNRELCIDITGDNDDDE